MISLQTQHALYFLGAFILPFVIIRFVGYKGAQKIIGEPDRTVPLPRYHHSHLGLVLIAIAAILQFKVGITAVTSVLLGLGLGFALDLFFPSAFIPQREPESTKIYVAQFLPTLIVFILVIVMVGVLVIV